MVIFGTGALATRMGWHLSRAGAGVTLVGTWQAALDAVAERGVGLEVDGVYSTAPAASASLGDAVGPAPLVLVLVKSHRTASVAPHALRAAAPGGLVLTLQNGLGNLEALEATLGEIGTSQIDPPPVAHGRSDLLSTPIPASISIAAGVTSLGAMSTGPGRAIAGGAGETVLGAPPDMETGARSILDGFAELLRLEGLDVRFEADLDGLVWRKVAVNCAINALSAIRGVPNGKLLQDETDRVLLRAAAGEVASVAAALGIAAGTPEELADLAETIARRTAENRSSMLQDIERGARTEIDALCGAIVRHGERAGVATPVNVRLWREILSLERRSVERAEVAQVAGAPVDGVQGTGAPVDGAPLRETSRW